MTTSALHGCLNSYKMDIQGNTMMSTVYFANIVDKFHKKLLFKNVVKYSHMAANSQ